MLSPQTRAFFIPIFLNHKSIFFLLMFDGAIAGISAVILPLLLKFETDQLASQNGGIFFGQELTSFQVFMVILGGIFLVDLFTYLIQGITDIFLQSKKDYLNNSIQLELFQKMNFMEVGKTMNGRFKYISNILDGQFSEYSGKLIQLPGGFLQSVIKIGGITAIFAYFDIRYLVIVLVASLFSYFIEKYSDVISQKYDIHWKFSLGRKVYFYNELFLRSFAQMATNGAVKPSLNTYKLLLHKEIENGLKKNWSGLVWNFSSILTGSLSRMLIKILVGFSVFEGTQSIGIVALVVASMQTVEDLVRKGITFRREYLRTRFQDSSILLFLEMCEPIGHIHEYSTQIFKVEAKNLSFSYPNLSIYEKKYMDIVQGFMNTGKTGSRWLDEAFTELVEGIRADVDRLNPVILRNVNFSFERGKIYGIVGKNGAGKTTMMQLIAGFFRSYEGEIFFNDQNVINWTPELLARNISFLTQEPFFMPWGSTIRDNLLFGVLEYDENRIWKYLEKFGLAEKIRKSPEGLNSEIGDKIDFSGGEKQILTFIRLLLQDRPIVILDEGTNQLDAENELLVMSELLSKKNDKIIIFITHRMSTISQADHIYCIDKHTVSHSGNHSALLEEGKNAYARFYRAQVLGER